MLLSSPSRRTTNNAVAAPVCIICLTDPYLARAKKEAAFRRPKSLDLSPLTAARHTPQGAVELSAWPHIESLELRRNRIDACRYAFAPICDPAATIPFTRALGHKCTFKEVTASQCSARRKPLGRRHVRFVTLLEYLQADDARAT